MLVSCKRLFSSCFQIIELQTQISEVLSSLFWLPGFSQDAVQNLHAWCLCTNRSCFFFHYFFFKVKTFYMLQRRGRKSHTPTLVQCRENQLREDYAHGWVQFIHWLFCFVDSKWWYSSCVMSNIITSCVISKCEVKMNLLTTRNYFVI